MFTCTQMNDRNLLEDLGTINNVILGNKSPTKQKICIDITCMASSLMRHFHEGKGLGALNFLSPQLCIGMTQTVDLALPKSMIKQSLLQILTQS